MLTVAFQVVVLWVFFYGWKLGKTKLIMAEFFLCLYVFVVVCSKISVIASYLRATLQALLKTCCNTGISMLLRATGCDEAKEVKVRLFGFFQSCGKELQCLAWQRWSASDGSWTILVMESYSDAEAEQAGFRADCRENLCIFVLVRILCLPAC